jgi:hypothetical protein
MACTVTRPQPYRDIVGRNGGRVELGQVWGRVSDQEALEAAAKAAWNTISDERLEG